MKNYLIDCLKSCFTYDTCHPSYRDQWSIINASAGHCAVASLVIQEFFGGEIHKVKVGRYIHYFNIINNVIIDSTVSQFIPLKLEVNYNDSIKVNRDKLLSVKNVNERYVLLKTRFLNYFSKK